MTSTGSSETICYWNIHRVPTAKELIQRGEGGGLGSFDQAEICAACLGRVDEMANCTKAIPVVPAPDDNRTLS